MARSGDFGWAGSAIWARREGLGAAQKANLGRKWVETEDEGASSCEKLRVVSAVRLEVAVCQNTPSEKGLETPRKGESGKEWVETRDAGTSSCEKLRVVSAVPLVVVVCQNTPFRNSNPCKSTENQNFGPPEYIQSPRSVGHPGLGPTELQINHPRWPVSYMPHLACKLLP